MLVIKNRVLFSHRSVFDRINSIVDRISGTSLFFTVSCELVNHCSGHGNCSAPSVCSCYDGFEGFNCSEGTLEFNLNSM